MSKIPPRAGFFLKQQNFKTLLSVRFFLVVNQVLNLKVACIRKSNSIRFFKHQIFKGVIQMAQEFYVDGIGNISIQGPVVTLSYVRTTSQGNKPEDNKDEEVIKITMTGQNLVKMTNILGSTLKRIAERNKNAQNNQSDEMKNNNDKENNSKKSKTVN